MPPSFTDWIARIRDRDPMTHEDAYWGERPTDPDFVARLVVELHRTPDGFTRGKILELLGESEDESVVPLLVEELSHPDQTVQSWAMIALENLGFPEGMEAARRYRELHGEDLA